MWHVISALLSYDLFRLFEIWWQLPRPPVWVLGGEPIIILIIPPPGRLFRSFAKAQGRVLQVRSYSKGVICMPARGCAASLSVELTCRCWGPKALGEAESSLIDVRDRKTLGKTESLLVDVRDRNPFDEAESSLVDVRDRKPLGEAERARL
ncbi:hypothetical protein BHE74_00043094 [Ensete ventricosum]|nr:hypothetical protein BHE74_00043094 [Ensete ventricosum]